MPHLFIRSISEYCVFIHPPQLHLHFTGGYEQFNPTELNIQECYIVFLSRDNLKCIQKIGLGAKANSHFKYYAHPVF